MSGSGPVTVVETPEFLVATRKLRWRLEGRGKRGGARVIYFYHGAGLPLFALTAYAKNVRDDLSQADKNDFRRLTKLLVESYARKRR